MARVKVEYEWVVEHMDEHGDIQDVWFYDTLSEMPSDWEEPADGCVKTVLGLRRYEYTDHGGTEDIEYYYPHHNNTLVLHDLDFKPEWTAVKSKQNEYDNFVKRSS